MHDSGCQTWYTQNRYIYVYHQQVCVLARLLFGNAAMKRSFIRIKSSKSGCGKGCGHNNGSSAVVWPMMIQCFQLSEATFLIFG